MAGHGYSFPFFPFPFTFPLLQQFQLLNLDQTALYRHGLLAGLQDERAAFVLCLSVLPGSDLALCGHLLKETPSLVSFFEGVGGVVERGAE